MIEAIRNGITNAIYNEFGNEYQLFVNKEEQGVVEPCFFVYMLEQTSEPKTMGRTFHATPFEITYFPRTYEQVKEQAGSLFEKTVFYDPNLECYIVSGKLMKILEYITLENGDILRGTSLRAKVVDGVLTVLVNYNYFDYAPGEGISMDELKQRQIVR